MLIVLRVGYMLLVVPMVLIVLVVLGRVPYLLAEFMVLMVLWIGHLT